VNDPDVDESPPSAAEAQQLIQQQRAAATRSLSPDPRFLYWPWGLAWLVGFGCLYLRHGPGGQVLVPMPSWLPLTVLYVMMTAAMVVSAVSGSRSARHIKGESQVKGATYGFAWFLGFAGIGVTAGRVSDLLPPPEIGLLWAGLSVGFVAAMYLAGGALWGERDMVILGVWIGVVNVIGVVVGPGWHSLVIATAGAGGLLVAGHVAARRRNNRA
jgi:hypothetical protein